MKRRAFLGAAVTTGAVAIAGCSSAGSSTAGSPEGIRRKIDVEVDSPLPDEAPVDFSIAVADQWATSESTATLEATVENTSDEARSCPPPYYKGHSDDAGEEGIILYNLQAANDLTASFVPSCFVDDRAEEDVNNDNRFVYWSQETYFGPELSPGESTTDTILVVDDPTTNGCLPAGSYAFRSSVSDGDDVSFDWSFTVTVEDVSESQP
ncbi:hypothetical protein GCM10028857_24660 [Salinarchaeum chitinilyticum]